MMEYTGNHPTRCDTMPMEDLSAPTTSPTPGESHPRVYRPPDVVPDCNNNFIGYPKISMVRSLNGAVAGGDHQETTELRPAFDQPPTCIKDTMKAIKIEPEGQVRHNGDTQPNIAGDRVVAVKMELLETGIVVKSEPPEFVDESFANLLRKRDDPVTAFPGITIKKELLDADYLPSWRSDESTEVGIKVEPTGPPLDRGEMHRVTGLKMERREDDDDEYDDIPLSEMLARPSRDGSLIPISSDSDVNPMIIIKHEDHSDDCPTQEKGNQHDAGPVVANSERRRSKRASSLQLRKTTRARRADEVTNVQQTGRISGEGSTGCGRRRRSARIRNKSTTATPATTPAITTPITTPTVTPTVTPIVKEEPCEKRQSGKTFKCKDCDKEFVSNKRLLDHSYIHTARHECGVCGKRFAGQNALDYHVMAHEGKKPHRCKFCKSRFTHKSNLYRHERIHQGVKIHKCSYCEKAFVTKPEVTIHERSVHTGYKPHKCTDCDMSFVCAPRLKMHRKVHSGDKPFECEVCKGRYSSLSMLSIHLRVHTDTRSQCRYCSKSFIYPSSVRRHELIHQTVKPHRCQFCDKGFVEKNLLRIHERGHTGDRPFSCEQCDKSFHSAQGLKSHTVTHNCSTRFECEECGKTYANLRTLEDHQKLHTGDDLHYCTDCGKGFPNTHRLDQHMVIHAEVRPRPYKCVTCDKSFSRKDSLNKHEARHGDVPKPHKCKECGKAFRLLCELRVHEIIHTDKKPFQCRFCGRSFNKVGNMSTHERNVHSGTSRKYKCRFCNGSFSRKGARCIHERDVHPGS